ncbi:hypothetical protein MDA_GLEAN10011184 [Myotis davidii]|uniref:Sperm acrosome-associated protein 9 n=1 Tax=Myotis davidii TaxID=225400 RepID=L5MFF1_MYODS|nr:hypothetical protein MDA_GLEAN10011184 [Myotis davidii]
MNEAKESLRSIEQKYKLFQQQQFTFVAALEHCRENAHDKIKPITSIEQVQSYTEHYCTNSTDRRILLMFLDICTELSRLCQRFETLHPGTPITNSFLDKCKTFVSQSNDLSSLRANTPPATPGLRSGSVFLDSNTRNPCCCQRAAWAWSCGCCPAVSDSWDLVLDRNSSPSNDHFPRQAYTYSGSQSTYRFSPLTA